MFSCLEECQHAFDKLKVVFTTDPILTLFDWDKKTHVETNASNVTSAGVLLQYDNDDIRSLVAFFSKKHSLVEADYNIYDKELTAIICTIEE